MAIKEREAQEERIEAPDTDAAEAQEADRGDDAEPDIDVERNGNDVVVRQNSQLTRGQRRALEREEGLVKKISGPLEERIAALTRVVEGYASRPIQAPQQQPPRVVRDEDELDPEYLDIIRQQDELSDRVSRCKTQAEVEPLLVKWHKLEKKRFQVLAPKPQPQPQREPELTAEEKAIKREHAAVFDNDDAKQLAYHFFVAAKVRAKSRKEPFDEASAHREALTRAGEEMGIYRPKSRPPSDAQRSRFASDRGGAPPSGSQGNSIKLTDAEKQAALVWGSDLGLSNDKVFARYAAILMKDKAYMDGRKG